MLRVMQTILNRRVPATPMSLPTLRHATRDALVEAGVDSTLFDDSIAVALSEAVGNAVRHAYPNVAGEIDLAVRPRRPRNPGHRHRQRRGV
jgi:anti-sigma regulatory factor (Ser/Thr protein kinase)